MIFECARHEGSCLFRCILAFSKIFFSQFWHRVSIIISFRLTLSPLLRLLNTCADGKPIIRSADSGDWIGTFEGHRGAVWKFRLNAAADQAVSASADFSAKVWDAIRGVEVASFDHKHIVKAAEFSPDGRAIVTGGHEKLLRIFDLEKPQEAPTVLSGHTKPISHAFFSVDGNLIYSAGEENDIRVWDRRSLTEVLLASFFLLP